MTANKTKEKLTILAGIGLFFLGGAAHLLSPFSMTYLYLAEQTIYIGLLIAWAVSVNKRIIRKDARRYLILMVVFMILYIIIRICKYRMFRGGGSIHRMTMNLYAIPTVMIPLMGFYAAACLGSAQNIKMKLWQKLLLIPAMLMIVISLTNDLHGLFYSESL